MMIITYIHVLLPSWPFFLFLRVFFITLYVKALSLVYAFRTMMSSLCPILLLFCVFIILYVKAHSLANAFGTMISSLCSILLIVVYFYLFDG